ncbi:MAG: hypothetical protein HYU81_03130 [Candidatus Brennerbacteria bacterium]|nr:hypothetical protein [Candidatus Brennerbacteria bacterium]
MVELKRKISDIVPRRPSSAKAVASKQSLDGEVRKEISPARKAPKKKESEPIETKRSAPPEPKEEPVFLIPPIREMRIDGGPAPGVEATQAANSPVGRAGFTGRYRGRRRVLRVGVGVLAILIAAGAGAWFTLPKAVITLTMKKYPMTFKETVVAAADPGTVSAPSAVVVPGEALEARANLTLPFAARDTETVSAKATGVLIVYNSYGSAPQTLVRNTRFESPDKKIFRLDRQVTVPGARVEGGRITASSVEAPVTAEEAGEVYNLPASSGWRIPGFRSTPRYDGFYAETKSGIKGGFIGERAKPSTTELADARNKLMEALTGALESQFLIILSDRFTALPGSRRVTLVEENISQDGEDPHAFHLFGEAVMEQIVFEDPMLREALVATAARALPKELVAKDFSYTVGTSTPDFAKRTLTFPVNGAGVFTAPFNADAFRASVTGKGEADLKAAVLAVPGVEAAKVSLSPFFVRSVPTDETKIEVTVE